MHIQAQKKVWENTHKNVNYNFLKYNITSSLYFCICFNYETLFLLLLLLLQRFLDRSEATKLFSFLRTDRRIQEALSYSE